MSKQRRSPVAGIEPLEDRKLLAASIKIVGNGQRIVPGDTSASRDDFTDYGPMALAGPITAAGRTYTIKNQGDAPLQMTGARISIQGADANQFSVSKSVKASIAAGGGATFRIKFDPTSAGVKRATIVVTSISQKSSYKFNIVGRGVTTTAMADGTHAATLTTGSGNGATTGTNMAIDYTGFFTYGNVFDSSINDPNRNPYPVTLGYTSVIQGWTKGLLGMKLNEQRVLFIPSDQAYGDGGNGIPANTPLIFETIATTFQSPAIKVVGNDKTVADGDTTPSSSDNTAFGSKARNASVSKSFTIFAGDNIGDAQANLTDNTTPIRVTGANASEFVIGAIASGVFTITFTPTGTGTRTARIEIPNNNANDNLYTFAVSGVGT